ncbi:MAG TPA: SPW repeat protein [Parafilimonas sp.]|nr:SPW repeat protein [Parafilimonas sp.]
MRFIPTKVHGVMDYLYALVLLFIPNIFHFSSNDAPTYVMDVVSSAVFTYSLFTKYELGLFKNIPMHVHLILDLVFGVLLAASPWIFGFADDVYKPHLFFGLFAIAAASFSKVTSRQIEKSTYSQESSTPA